MGMRGCFGRSCRSLTRGPDRGSRLRPRDELLARRGFLRAAAAAGAALALRAVRQSNTPRARAAQAGQSGATAEKPGAVPGETSPDVTVRTITRPPGFHWFGYYDKLQVDPSGRYALGMAVDFEHRTPRADDVIRIGMVDLEDDDRWIELDSSRAWCWQQGCMLQWIPSSQSKILWNDRQDDRFVCHTMDVKTRQRRIIPHPIYALGPDGRSAVSADFRRIQAMRPGYGYVGPADPLAHELAPRESGIFRVDLESGRQELIVSLADVAAIAYPHGDLSAMKHYFNHLLVSPDGRRFVFLHRWRGPGQRSFGTRMLTARLDGTEVRVIDHSGRTSHFIWRDPQHILAWTHHPSHGNAFYLFEDREGGKVEPVGLGVMTRNGHCSYLPGSAWILNDTYPTGAERLQELYLYHVPTRRRVVLGRFHSPPEYQGEWRCDLHPRFSPDGRSVLIDSPHTGAGRQLHLIDISRIVG